MANKITKSCRKDPLLAGLMSLTKRCPVGEGNPEDCPLFPARKLKPAARLKWFKALTEEDLDYLAAYHHVCMDVRLAENGNT